MFKFFVYVFIARSSVVFHISGCVRYDTITGVLIRVAAGRRARMLRILDFCQQTEPL